MAVNHTRLRLLASAALLWSAAYCLPVSAQHEKHASSTQEKPHWNYTDHGPAAWGTLSPEFVACIEGKNQSPIDFATAKPAPSETSISYGAHELRIVHHRHQADVINTGHSIQVNYPGADTLVLGGVSYALAQYHFHTPSEHTVAGKHYPAEMHFVHMSADKKLAVVGVFIETGKHNRAFDPIWSNLPKKQGEEKHLPNVKVDVDALLPLDHAMFRYDGSLTTPPCSEGVSWLVFATPVQLSESQLTKLRGILDGNSRPTQPLNGRNVGRVEIKTMAAAQ